MRIQKLPLIVMILMIVATTDVDERESIGIMAEMTETREANMPGTAHAKVEVLDGATVTADKAVVFESGRGTLNVTNSRIVGDVEFDAGGLQ